MVRKMSVSNCMLIVLSIIIIVLVIVVITLSLKGKSPPQVFNRQALKILEPGNYLNQGITNPTKLYPKGLITNGKSMILRDNLNNIVIKETYQASDALTNNFEYKRDVHYEFSQGPQGAFYMIRKSFLNNQIMSIRTGYGIKVEADSIHFLLRGNFYTTGSYYQKILFSITKKSDGYQLTIKRNKKIHAEYTLIKKEQ